MGTSSFGEQTLFRSARNNKIIFVFEETRHSEVFNEREEFYSFSVRNRAQIQISSPHCHCGQHMLVESFHKRGFLWQSRWVICLPPGYVRQLNGKYHGDHISFTLPAPLIEKVQDLSITQKHEVSHQEPKKFLLSESFVCGEFIWFYW